MAASLTRVGVLGANNQIVEKKKEENKALKFFEKTAAYAFKLRYYFGFLKNIGQFDSIKNSPRATGFIKFIAVASKPIALTSVLNVIHLVKSVPDIIKSGKKFVSRDGVDRIPVTLKVIKTFSAIAEAINDVRRGLSAYITPFKVSYTVSSVFSGIGIVGSVAGVVLSSKALVGSQSNLNEFVKTVSYNKEGKYSFKDYNNLCNFFERLPKHLGKEFGMDGEKFYQNMKQKLGTLRLNGAQLNQKQNDLNAVINALKSRLETQKNDKILSIVNNTVNLALSTVLAIASVTNPIFFLAWTGYSVTYGTVNYIQKQIQIYNFENKMGFINREVKDISTTTLPVVAQVKDFCKWYFGYFSKPSVLSQEVIDLAYKVKQPLLSV
jgi:methyl-accepting chemotaxis protein